MDDLYFARISKIRFYNFRNIENGTIDFPNSEFKDFLIEENPSILGLYGQNGSGKTSVILAIELLKDILSGKPLDDRYLSCIKSGSEKCTLEYTFSMYSKMFDENKQALFDNLLSQCYEVSYQFDIVEHTKREIGPLVRTPKADQKRILRIENEILKYRGVTSFGKILFPKQTYIDTSVSNEKYNYFGSEIKNKSFTGNDEEIIQRLRSYKYFSYENSQSYVFNIDALNLIGETIVNNGSLSLLIQKIKDAMEYYEKRAEVNNDKEEDCEGAENKSNDNELNMFNDLRYNLSIFIPVILIANLTTFGSAYLHVINTVTTGITNVNSQLPLLLWSSSKEAAFYHDLSLNMDGKTEVDEKSYEDVKKSITNLNLVLSSIIPGLSLEISDPIPTVSKEGNQASQFEIFSIRDNVKIPLKYESDGIRRIVSILSLLIAAYNEASFTIAIDEIDSGIYEYLLGEILSVFSDSSKGQLIFTSHNLRPLEVLPAKFLCFTTTNPNNRFIKIANRGNSNLRDGYFRSIVLDTQKEQVYKPTNKYDIQSAFYKAGHGADQHG